MQSMLDSPYDPVPHLHAVLSFEYPVEEVVKLEYLLVVNIISNFPCNASIILKDHMENRAWIACIP